MSENHYHLIVIGLGLSGLMAAFTAAQAGKRVLVVGKGTGRLCLFSSSIDLLNSTQGDMHNALSSWIAGHPEHPYAKAGPLRTMEALSEFGSLFSAPYLFTAVGPGNCLVPTGAGTRRATYLVPSTMTAGVEAGPGGLIVGFEHFRDFSAHQAAAGLNARGVTIPLGVPAGQGLTSLALARLFEDRSFRGVVMKEIKQVIAGEERVGFPAVLGLRDPGRVKEELEGGLGARVFEIPILPPSVPGIRISNRFKTWFNQGTKVTLLLGPSAGFPMIEDHRCSGLRVVNPPISTFYSADSYVLATGRFLSGGLVADRERVREPLFGLPVIQPESREDWFGPSFFDSRHALNRAGIRVDGHFRPLDGEGRVILDNVRIAGSILAYHDSIEEGSREGISLSTGYGAAREAIES